MLAFSRCLAFSQFTCPIKSKEVAAVASMQGMLTQSGKECAMGMRAGGESS
jgi:hypothetical protein